MLRNAEYLWKCILKFAFGNFPLIACKYGAQIAGVKLMLNRVAGLP